MHRDELEAAKAREASLRTELNRAKKHRQKLERTTGDKKKPKKRQNSEDTLAVPVFRVLAIVIGVIALLSFWLFRDRPASEWQEIEPEAVATPPEVANDKPDPVAAPTLSLGLKGLSLGMTKAQASAALPAIEQSKPTAAGDDSGIPSVRVVTTIGDIPGACFLYFAGSEQGLTKIKCALGDLPVRLVGAGLSMIGSFTKDEQHCASQRTLLSGLSETYGSPTDKRMLRPITGMPTGRKGRSCSPGSWSWSSRGTSLTLTSKLLHTSMIGAELSLTLEGQEHARVLREKEQEDQRRMRIERHERDVRTKRELDEILRDAGNEQRSLQSDISAGAEAP